MLPDHYRELMSAWTTGVSILTSVDADGRPSGCTANAFTALSLDPPLVLLCFDRTARTLRAARESGRVAINVLSAEQQDLSRTFASKASHEEKFEQVEYRMEDGAPVIEDVLAYIVTEVREELAGGDHVIVVAEVVGGRHGPPAEPLVFFRSGYRTLSAT